MIAVALAATLGWGKFGERSAYAWMAAALQKAGKPVELVVLKGEDHWLTTGETRLAMLQAVIAFLEKHNPPN